MLDGVHMWVFFNIESLNARATHYNVERLDFNMLNNVQIVHY